MFSKRSDWSFSLNLLTERLVAARRSGRKILDLTESNPTRCAFQYPPGLFSALANPANLTYEPSPKGKRQAREVIVGYYAEKGISLNPEQILLTASTSEAYSFLFRLLLNPGETVLTPRPSYPLFEYLASLNDVTQDYYPLLLGPDWRIDLESLKKSVSSDTRAIRLVNPNNPTGSFVKKEEKEFLEALSREKNIPLIADEVFLDYRFEEGEAPTFSGEERTLTFTLSGISKILALPQMKLSWIVVNGPKELQQGALERLEIIADTYLSVNTPSQNALKEWFSFRKTIQSQIQKRLLQNRERLLQTVSNSPCRVLPAEGGWYALLKLPDGVDEEKWALELLEKEDVLIHPGYFFDFSEESLVLSLLVPPDIFQEGLSRLLACLQKNP